jgi:hypothetical protein
VFYQAMLATGPEEGDTMQRAVATFVKCDMLGVTEMKGHHPDKVAAAGERVVGCKPPPADDARWGQHLPLPASGEDEDPRR